MNLFAIVEGPQKTVQRIRVEQTLQQQLGTEFENQREVFFGQSEVVEFDPRYKVDDDELFVIRDFELPHFMINAIRNINQVDNLHLDADVRIKAIFAAESASHSSSHLRVYFQKFMQQQLLVKRWTLLGNRDTYRKLEDPGLMLGSSLVAFYEEDKEMLFRSYTLVNRIIGLEPYFIEATDDDIHDVLGDDKFEVENVSDILANADTVMRKRFMAVKASEILSQITVRKVQAQARNFNVEIEIRGGKIVFPTERKQAKEFLRLLLEGYYEGPLTGTRYVTNSQRTISE